MTKPRAATPAPQEPAPAPPVGPEGREARFIRLIGRIKAEGVTPDKAAELALAFVTPPWGQTVFARPAD